MTETPLAITLKDLSQSDRAQAIVELRDMLRHRNTDGTVELRQDHATAMDMGATLVVALGTGAALAVANGIRVFLAKWQGASVDIEGDKVTVRNVTSKDAVRISEIVKNAQTGE